MIKRLLLSMVLIAVLLALPAMAQHGPSAQAANEQLVRPAAPAAQPRYNITDLGTLGGAMSQGMDTNENNQVVGASQSGSYAYAFLWDDGTMTNLGDLGGQGSWAHDINDAGQVVGGSPLSSGENHAFLWDGSMQDLGTLGGPVSYAFEINSAEQAVGYALNAEGIQHAVLWGSGGIVDLGDLDPLWPNHSAAYGINDAGQVVGGSYTDIPGQFHAFVWQNGSMQDLGTLGGGYSSAEAINEDSQVVGASRLPDDTTLHAFLWDGSMQDLGALGWERSIAYDINDKEQVVGMLQTGQNSHAFLWANGQMQDLNDEIPTDSGWVLSEARAINNKGQIAGFGLINGQTHAFLLTPHLPVLIVPGIAGSYAANVGSDIGWLTHRGVRPNELQVDPLGHVYDDLVQTFKNLGYEEGRDLFVVNYDWRLPPGPSDGQFDGHISGLNAQTLADDQFNYAVDYLGYYLHQAADAYRQQYGGELPQVNIISHSTGGLIARTYIQSDAYGGVYDAANNYHLPEADQFIMVGVPNRGASKAWNPIHNNWIADVAYRVVLSKIINRAYQKVAAFIGTTIQGPDYDIDKASIMVNGTPNEELFIEKYVPTIRSLLATYDFIDFGKGYVNVNNDPALRNNLVLDLNNGLDLVPTADPNPFADATTTTVICGAGSYTANLVVERTGTPAEDVLLPFTDFFPNDADANDVWYEDLWLANGGDQTVPLESCQEQFIGDARINIRLFTGAKTDHTGLMSNVDVQSSMLDVLKIEYETQDISTGTGASLINAISVISDPAETILVDGSGRRLGYSQATGVLTEIPGSIWFGDADGFGLVTGDFVEPLHLELTGLGEEYYVMASVEQFGRPAGGAVSSGFLTQGQMLTIPVEITTRSIFLPLVSR